MILWLDCIHDDTDALKAWLAGDDSVTRQDGSPVDYIRHPDKLYVREGEFPQDPPRDTERTEEFWSSWHQNGVLILTWPIYERR